jgi:hypothetical protein
MMRNLFLLIALALSACSGSDEGSTPVSAPAPGTLALSWTAPASNTDGTPLTDIAGYRISYGMDPATLDQTVNVSAGATAVTLLGLTSRATYFITVRTLNSAGVFSAPSAVVSHAAS